MNARTNVYGGGIASAYGTLWTATLKLNKDDPSASVQLIEVDAWRHKRELYETGG